VKRVVPSYSLLALSILASGFGVAASHADETGQPYIDEIKSKMKDPSPVDPETNPSGGSVSPYIDTLKKDIPADNSEGYTQQLKEKLGPEGNGKTDSYTQDEKGKIGPEDQDSAIAQVNEGRSQLKYEKKGEVKNSFGLIYGVGLTRNATAPVIGTGRAFSSIYGSNYAPDLALFFERQLVRKEWGTLGVFGMLECGIFQGFGTFQVTPTNPTVTPTNPTGNGTVFSSQSQTLFHFIEFPGVGGLSYRFQLSKYVQPFAMAGPAGAGFVEQRNDGFSGNQALAYGYYWNAGVAFQMDWFNKTDDFDRYDEYTIKHTYLTLDYSQFATIGGSPVLINVSGPALGVTFEF
jgi:hypothetical protein